MQGLAFAQEFRGKKDVVGTQLLAQAGGIADRDGRTDQDQRIGIDLVHGPRHGFDAGGVEIVGVGIVVRRRGDHREVAAGDGRRQVGGRGQVEPAVGEVFLDIGVDDRALAGIHRGHAVFGNINGGDVVVLGQQHGVRQPHIADTNHSYLHVPAPLFTGGPYIEDVGI